MPHSDDWKWRIAGNESFLISGKASMLARGIPAPTQAPFRAFTTRNARGPGGVSEHGHMNDEILWVRLTYHQYHVVRYIVDFVGSGLLYLTVPRTDGYTPGLQWVDISGYPSLEDGGPMQPMSGVHGNTPAFISNVLLKINNISVLNENPEF